MSKPHRKSLEIDRRLSRPHGATWWADLILCALFLGVMLALALSYVFPFWRLFR